MVALVYGDRVKETTTTTGTGTKTLAGAVTGYRTFTSVLSNGQSCTYCVEDGTDWEVVEGVFTTSGTTLSVVTVIASSNAGAAVSWAAGTRNVFLVESAREVYPGPALTFAPTGTTGCLAATFDRAIVPNNDANPALTSGTLRLYRIFLPKGIPVTNISFWTGNTALATGTHQWFGLFDSALAVLAKTADDTNVAWAANTKKTLAVASGPFITTYAGMYYVGALVTASTMPNLAGVALTGTSATPHTQAPIPHGNSTTGLTTPASCTGTQTGLTAVANHAYAELS